MVVLERLVNLVVRVVVELRDHRGFLGVVGDFGELLAEVDALLVRYLCSLKK